MSDNKNQDAKNELEALRAQKAELEKKLAEAKKETEEARAGLEAAEAKAREQAERISSEVARQEKLIARQLKEQRKARIIIASGKGSNERAPVPVGVNGREFLIERDKEVDVPEGVLNVLDLALAQVAETSEAGGMSQSGAFHSTARFSYRVLGYVNPATGELERA